MIDSVLKNLLAGEFVCPVAHPTEYNLLADPEVHDRVERNLNDLGNRLARTNPDDGAYYMAPLEVSSVAIAKIKDDLRRFRDVFGPAVLLLDMIRQTDSSEIALSPGEVIRLATMEELIIESASLENQLKNLAPVIKGFNVRNSIRENFKRVMEQLREDGYVTLFNPQADVYKITGKIEYLYSVIEYMSENEAVQTERVDDELAEEQTVIDGMTDV